MPPVPPLSIQPLHPLPANYTNPALVLSRLRQMDVRKEPVHYTQKAPPGAGQDTAVLMERLAASCRTKHFFCWHEIAVEQLADDAKAFGSRPTHLRLSLNCVIDRPVASAPEPSNPGGTIVQVQWRLTGAMPPLCFFRAFSHVGVWNHLILDGNTACRENCRTAALAPNIIHSWETIGNNRRPGTFSPVYGQVGALPGRPLWQAVTNPVKRFLLVDRLTKNRLVRLRIDDDQERLFSIGEKLNYSFVPPDRLPEGYLDRICAMVAAGGTVAATHVRTNLQQAFLIGYVEDNGILVANSSLKNPRAKYIKDVHRRSGLDLSGYVERGYTSVRPEYRGLGIGTRLLEGLTHRAGEHKIFSVISEDNAATQTIAVRNRARKVATYFSPKAGKSVGIWMPEWMIDSDETKCLQ